MNPNTGPGERKSIKPGYIVDIVQKQDQRNGKLTRGVVLEILTKVGLRR